MSERYTRMLYQGATPGADSADYVLFSTTVAFPGKCGHQLAGLNKVVLNLYHTQAGTVKLYRSSDRGTTWTQVRESAKTAPAAGESSNYETIVECFEDFKLVWTNGGVAQATFYPDVALTDERAVAGEGAAAVPALPAMLGLGNLNSSSFLVTAVGQPAIEGSASGFHVALAMRPLAGGGASVQVVGNMASDGWRVLTVTSSTIAFQIRNGAGTIISSPALTLTPFVGKLILLHGVFDGSFVRLYCNGVEVGSGTSVVGYTVALSRLLFPTTATVTSDWFAMSGGSTVPSLANIAAHAAALKATQAWSDVPGVASEHSWKTIALAAPADSIGGINMSFLGSSHTLVQANTADWGY